MKKYHFELNSALFRAPKEVEYNELGHKILNENIKGIKVIVLAENIGDANSKAETNIQEIIARQLSDYPQIGYYKFLLKITEIEEL